MTDRIRVGIIGGGSIAKAHVIGLRAIRSYFGAQEVKADVVVVADVNPAAAQVAAQKYAIDQWSADWCAVVEGRDVDAVVIAAPNDVHATIAIAAMEAGKHVLCEKPLANSVEAAREMVAAADRTGVINMVNLNYRNIPAIQYAKRLIEEGQLGRIINYRAAFLMDWAANPLVPRSWKFDSKHTGGGPVLAVGCHVIDLAHYLVGEITQVVGTARTTIRERPLPNELNTYALATGAAETAPVDTEDLGAMLVQFGPDGPVGTIEATRVTHGRKTHCYVEVNGTEGSIVFDYERMNEIQVATAQTAGLGLARVVIGPAQDGGLFWALGGLGVGFAETVALQMRNFMRSISTGIPTGPTFRDGLRAQEVAHAALNSARTGTWQQVVLH